MRRNQNTSLLVEEIRALHKSKEMAEMETTPSSPPLSPEVFPSSPTFTSADVSLPLTNHEKDKDRREFPRLYENRKKGISLGCLIMVKDEEKRIHVTLESIKTVADCVIIYDTGSTDQTIPIIKEFCTKNKIKLYLKEDEFVTFDVSRNASLDFADDKADFLLSLDSNDELKSPVELLNLVKNHRGNLSLFHILQKWDVFGNITQFYNSRLFKSRHGWRYKGVVHEYIDSSAARSISKHENIVLFQDRKHDVHKSSKRYEKDKELLYNEYKRVSELQIENKKKGIISEGVDPRSIFYLSQTAECLNQLQEAFSLYRERAAITDRGFKEEAYVSSFRAAQMARKMGFDYEIVISLYQKASEFSSKYFKQVRMEPSFKIAQIYFDQGLYTLAYTTLKSVINLPYPLDILLFIERIDYTLHRYLLYGKICFSLKNYIEAIKYLMISVMETNSGSYDETEILKMVHIIVKDSQLLKYSINEANSSFKISKERKLELIEKLQARVPLSPEVD